MALQLAVKSAISNRKDKVDILKALEVYSVRSHMICKNNRQHYLPQSKRRAFELYWYASKEDPSELHGKNKNFRSDSLSEVKRDTKKELYGYTNKEANDDIVKKFLKKYDIKGGSNTANWAGFRSPYDKLMRYLFYRY